MGESTNKIINYGNIENVTDSCGDIRSYMVYCHIAPNGKVYIGQTCFSLEQRAKKNGSGYRTCTCFYNAIKKHGWDNFKHIELINGLSKEMADLVEIELIKKYKTQDIENGYNLSCGGTIPVNKKTVYQYNMQGLYVNKYDNLSIAASHFNVSRLRPYVYLYDDIFRSCDFLWTFTYYGDQLSHDILDQISWRISTHGVQKKCRKVYQYDTNYNLLSIFKSCKDAMEQTGINQYNIKSACVYHRLYNDYIWSYNELDDDLISEYELTLKNNCKVIYQYASDGKLVNTFLSQTEAAQSIGIGRTCGISSCCNGKLLISHGFVWSYEILSKEEVINRFYNSYLKSNKWHKAEKYLNEHKEN